MYRRVVILCSEVYMCRTFAETILKSQAMARPDNRDNILGRVDEQCSRRISVSGITSGTEFCISIVRQ